MESLPFGVVLHAYTNVKYEILQEINIGSQTI